ncbi:hypothetical protein [Flavobacterium sp.]|uniref:hypothetical protein n=1 Tax=Flavobacterium sp. TaxID=239 RepID=UPI004033CE99
MKILLPCLLFLSAFANAQNINGRPLESLDSKYIEIMIEGKLFSSRLRAMVDYGQPVKGFTAASERYVKNDEGKPMEFNSVAHILNFFSPYGYKLQEVYTVREDEATDKVVYVMGRE